MSDRLKKIIALLPDGATLTLTRSALEELAGGPVDPSSDHHPIMPDLSISDIMAATNKARSTVHGWIKSRELEAYDFGNEKRVRPEAWERFLERRRGGKKSMPAPLDGNALSGDADLGSWRKHLKKAS